MNNEGRSSLAGEGWPNWGSSQSRHPPVPTSLEGITTLGTPDICGGGLPRLTSVIKEGASSGGQSVPALSDHQPGGFIFQVSLMCPPYPSFSAWEPVRCGEHRSLMQN